MSKAQPEILEESYCDGGDGWVKTRIVKEGEYSRYIEATLSHYGTPMTVRIPLVNHAQMGWLAAALIRTANTDPGKGSFDRGLESRIERGKEMPKIERGAGEFDDDSGIG